MGGRAACADPRLKMFINTVRHQEFRVLRPSIAALCKADLFFAERLAVSIGCVLLVWRTVTYMAVKNDERRPTLRFPEGFEGVFDAVSIVSIANPQNIPSITQEAGRHVLREGNASVAFDCDVIVVVHPAEMVEPQMCGKRSRFRRNALHHATIAANGVDVVIEHLKTGHVEVCSEPLLSNGHSHARGDALAERTGCCLDARDPVVLGMTRCLTVKLTKAPYIFERHGRLPQPFVLGIHRLRLRQVQHGPEQHGGMTIRKHEPVAIRPDGVLRIEAHDAVPDGVHQRGEPHRRTGMPGFRLLHRVNRKSTNRIDA